MSLTTALIQVGKGGEVTFADQVRTIGIELVRNPIIMGLALGLLVNVSGLAIPVPLDRMAEMVGAAAVPTALFALGASLAGYPITGDVPPAMILTALKTVVHPALVWILAVPVFGLEGIWVPVAVTMAAMPTGVVVYLFRARYNAAQGVAARTVLLSTILSMGTISLILIWFKGGF
jgi:predicted permease